MGGAAHRARQFFDALRVGGDEALDLGEALVLLNPRQQALFLGQAPRDRRHALECYARLRDGEEALRRAALLHDVAKGDVRIYERVLFVLLSAGSSRWLGRLAADDGAHWRRSLSAMLYHAERGAELARGAGAHPETVRLIRMHHEPPAHGDEALRRLREADDRS